jgi:hypothetical protein
MRQDPARERLGLQEIVAGLAEMETCLDAPNSALQPFKVACSVYESQLRGLFGGWNYESKSFRECVMFVAAAMDMVRYFRLVRNKSQFRNLRKHLALIDPGFFGVAGTFTVQQSKGSNLRAKLTAHGIASPTDAVAKDAARKTIELMLAMAAMNTFDNVAVEHPHASSVTDPNPDLIIEHAGHRYGVACKSLSTTSEETFKERVAEGIVQLERAVAANKVDSRRGVVLLDISSLLEHERLFMPEKFQFWKMKDSGKVLKHAINGALGKVFATDLDRSFHDVLSKLYKGRRLPVGILIYAHCLMICENKGAAIPVYQKALELRSGGDTSSILDFCKRLNLALHCQRVEK